MSALKLLGANKRAVPVAVTLASPVAVSSKAPLVQVRLSTVWGDPLPEMAVTADSAKQLATGATFLNKEAMSAVSGQPGLYQLNLMAAKARPTRGFYQLAISAKLKAAKSNLKLISVTGANVELKVCTSHSV